MYVPTLRYILVVVRCTIGSCRLGATEAVWPSPQQPRVPRRARYPDGVLRRFAPLFRAGSANRATGSWAVPLGTWDEDDRTPQRSGSEGQARCHAHYRPRQGRCLVCSPTVGNWQTGKRRLGASSTLYRIFLPARTAPVCLSACPAASLCSRALVLAGDMATMCLVRIVGRLAQGARRDELGVGDGGRSWSGSPGS